MNGTIEKTVYDTISDIDDVDRFDDFQNISEMSEEEIVGSDIGTYLAITEQIELEKKRQKELKKMIFQKQIDKRKNEIFSGKSNILSDLKIETHNLEEKLNNLDEIIEVLDDKEPVKEIK